VLRANPNAGTDVPLDIVLHTPGGLGPCGIADRPGDPRPQGKGQPCSLPHYAMSGGTLIALAADENRHVPAFGAGGRSTRKLEQSPAASLLKVVEQKAG